MSGQKKNLDIESKLDDLGIALPRPPTAIGNFAAGVVFENILYVSGTYGTVKDENGVDYIPTPGRLGENLSIEEGYESARLMLLNHFAMAKSVLGDLTTIKRPIRLVGYVNSVASFQDAPSILNGASDLLLQIFGDDRGAHARMALYQHSLARQAPIAGEIMFGLET